MTFESFLNALLNVHCEGTPIVCYFMCRFAGLLTHLSMGYPAWRIQFYFDVHCSYISFHHLVTFCFLCCWNSSVPLFTFLFMMLQGVHILYTDCFQFCFKEKYSGNFTTMFSVSNFCISFISLKTASTDLLVLFRSNSGLHYEITC